MSADTTATKTSNKHMTIGAALTIVGVAIGLFAHAHRPPEGFVDALERADSWAFTPTFYYGLLFIAVLIGLAGVLRLVQAFRK